MRRRARRRGGESSWRRLRRVERRLRKRGNGFRDDWRKLRDERGRETRRRARRRGGKSSSGSSTRLRRVERCLRKSCDGFRDERRKLRDKMTCVVRTQPRATRALIRASDRDFHGYRDRAESRERPDTKRHIHHDTRARDVTLHTVRQFRTIPFVMARCVLHHTVSGEVIIAHTHTHALCNHGMRGV